MCMCMISLAVLQQLAGTHKLAAMPARESRDRAHTTQLWPRSESSSPDRPEPQPRSSSMRGVLSSGSANSSMARSVRVACACMQSVRLLCHSATNAAHTCILAMREFLVYLWASSAL